VPTTMKRVMPHSAVNSFSQGDFHSWAFGAAGVFGFSRTRCFSERGSGELPERFDETESFGGSTEPTRFM
jgi:hypothetical protein